jgi:alkylhydroperoxidase family enzyme
MLSTAHFTLVLPLVAVFLLPAALLAATASEPESRFRLLSDDECWQKLPPAEKGRGQALPSWAQALAGVMPRTTAALLRLDHVHRTRGPLDPKLRAQMRWVAAHANHCAYGEAYAAFDAARAGVADDQLEALRRGDFSQKSPAEKSALEFAHKMTVKSAAVTDAEFAALVKAYGERQTAAMVLLMAHANFQDRLLLCLGMPVEPGGPRPPVDVRFAPDAVETKMAKPLPSAVSALPKPTGKDVVEDDGDWSAFRYADLQSLLENQRRKSTRLNVPKWEDVERGLPPGFMRPSRIVWNQICLGYVPELATAWETLMRTNMPEMRSKLDRVFGISVFWVVTRTIECPYCMGHCEMNWEVAGLTPALIAERSQLLAGTDWSSFAPEEQRAFAFARKLTRYPARISTEDIDSLKQDFGPERALFLLMYACRCNYMTRISNGFQLGLERDNVFFDYYADDPASTAAGSKKEGR